MIAEFIEFEIYLQAQTPLESSKKSKYHRPIMHRFQTHWAKNFVHVCYKNKEQHNIDNRESFPRVTAGIDFSLNAHYIILFRNNRDQSQIACFSRQVFSDRFKCFMDAYKKATADEYQFLLVDFFPTTDGELRLRQSIFKKKGVMGSRREIDSIKPVAPFYPLRVRNKEVQYCHKRADKHAV
ncbi:uncharacterized protein CEXT_323611 [Caerostris extrusa]|uniref:Transposase n=1 Tax=Caerostris extrusa TaxID=172846 RepID=A0AAV4S8A2_CAEEX|nr:uncharacterized protein CEXT_323611 [Caerostris extrusa]